MRFFACAYSVSVLVSTLCLHFIIVRRARLLLLLLLRGLHV